MIARNLAICLGVTGLSSVLLFLYFRHRVASVEEKLEALFQLIQKEARDSMNDRIQFNEKTGSTQENNNIGNNNLVELTQKEQTEKIEVSESESESDSESDSESESEVERLSISEASPEIAEVINSQLETVELKYDIHEEVKEELSDKSPEDKVDSADEDSLDELI